MLGRAALDKYLQRNNGREGRQTKGSCAVLKHRPYMALPHLGWSLHAHFDVQGYLPNASSLALQNFYLNQHKLNLKLWFCHSFTWSACMLWKPLCTLSCGKSSSCCDTCCVRVQDFGIAFAVNIAVCCEEECPCHGNPVSTRILSSCGSQISNMQGCIQFLILDGM